MRPVIRWSAWLCLSLMLWTAAVESTHNHPNKTESACSICVVAHSTAAATSSGTAHPVLAAIGLTHEEDFIARVQFVYFELGSRGPPNTL